MRVLLVEDDKTIIEMLSEFLQEEGYTVDAVCGQSEALICVESNEYDIVLLDIALQEGNGYAVCRGIKDIRDIPVIFLTASSDEFSVVTGLDLGADDYISKPFRPRELLSRMKSVLRRYGKSRNNLDFGELRIDTVKGMVKKRGGEIFLSALEYRLLLIFASHKGQLLTRGQLLTEIWDMAGEFVNDNTLTVYIKRLREKIEDDPQNPKMIKTVRGMGYLSCGGKNEYDMDEK